MNKLFLIFIIIYSICIELQYCHNLNEKSNKFSSYDEDFKNDFVEIHKKNEDR